MWLEDMQPRDYLCSNENKMSFFLGEIFVFAPYSPRLQIERGHIVSDV